MKGFRIAIAIFSALFAIYFGLTLLKAYDNLEQFGHYSNMRQSMRQQFEVRSVEFLAFAGLSVFLFTRKSAQSNTQDELTRGTLKPPPNPPAPVRRTYPSTEAGFLAWLRDSGKKSLDGDQIESLRQTFYENQNGGND